MQETVASGEMVLAEWTQCVQQSTIQQLLAVATRPDILSFALGLPATELFPRQEYAQAVAQVLEHDPQALQYGMPCQSLRQHIAEIMTYRGVACQAENVFLTAGAQQGMSLLSRLLLNRHGAIIVEEIIYSGILQAVEPLQPTLLTVPTDPETGMDVDAVASHLAGPHQPAFIYTITDGHNPRGVSMSMEKRQHLVELARRYRVPIIEDDAYGLLTYDACNLPPLRALDHEWVFYLGSFSKIIAPALRIGWVIVPEKLLSLLYVLKEGSDINTGNIAQRVTATYLATGQLPERLIRLRQEYRNRRDRMLSALQHNFPAGVHYTKPRSGLFIWVEMPGELDTAKVLEIALAQEQVAFVPGHAFSVAMTEYATRCMRLNFSHCTMNDIEEGIIKLGKVLSQMSC